MPHKKTKFILLLLFTFYWQEKIVQFWSANPLQKKKKVALFWPGPHEKCQMK